MKWLNIFVFFILSNLLLAQEQDISKNELKNLTTEEKLDIAVSNSISYMIMGISYAKTLGKTPEEFAEHSAEMIIPAYQFLRGKQPIDLINIMNRVQQTDKFFVIEISETSDLRLKGKMSLFGINNIKTASGLGGATEDDCYRFYNKFVQTLSSGIGFKYEYIVKDGRIEFSLDKN